MVTLNYSTAPIRDILDRINTLKSLSSFSSVEKAEIVDAVSNLQIRLNANPANLLETSTTELENIKVQIEQAKKDLLIAEQRVATLRHPEKDKSYYESWFPINRPLTNHSIIIITGIGIFFFILSFLIILKAFGLNISISMPWDNPEVVAKISSFIPPIIAMNFNKILIVLIILFIVLYATKS